MECIILGMSRVDCFVERRVLNTKLGGWEYFFSSIFLMKRQTIKQNSGIPFLLSIFFNTLLLKKIY
ncbi:hypothetical protein C6N29_12295 [Flavobacterium columnare]|nr:hypothetical protein [Flavobacterium columnare]PTD15147.1 hypothetical protein C6N29_12295 [Flavobacterium columnare]